MGQPTTDNFKLVSVKHYNCSTSSINFKLTCSGIKILQFEVTFSFQRETKTFRSPSFTPKCVFTKSSWSSAYIGKIQQRIFTQQTFSICTQLVYFCFVTKKNQDFILKFAFLVLSQRRSRQKYLAWVIKRPQSKYPVLH